MWVKSTQQALQHFYCVLTVSHAPPTTVHLGNQRLGTSDCSNIQSFSSRWLGNEEVILLKTLCSIEKIYWCLKKLNNCDIFCTLFDTWDWVRDIRLFFGGGFPSMVKKNWTQGSGVKHIAHHWLNLNTNNSPAPKQDHAKAIAAADSEILLKIWN